MAWGWGLECYQWLDFSHFLTVRTSVALSEVISVIADDVEVSFNFVHFFSSEN